MVSRKKRTSSSVFQAVRTPNLWALVPDRSAKSAGEVASTGASPRRVNPSAEVAGKSECTEQRVVETIG